MKWRPPEHSLFAILARSPWWVSLLVAAGIFAVARVFVPDVYALFVPLPFYATGGYAAWRQLGTPSAARVERTLAAVRALSWEEFAQALEDAYRREGYAVTRLDGAAADFELAKGWRKTLVAAKRWKAQRAGIEPLRELAALRRAREAQDCVYVAAGELSETARKFAAENAIGLVQGAELAKLLPRAGRQ
jgi:restriction system protein